MAFFDSEQDQEEIYQKFFADFQEILVKRGWTAIGKRDEAMARIAIHWVFAHFDVQEIEDAPL